MYNNFRSFVVLVEAPDGQICMGNCYADFPANYKEVGVLENNK